MRTTVRSPGSEFESQPLRHAVRSKNHARIVLPRNHSSGRNLAKLARQAAAGEASASRAHARTRSHEGDTEIRLPGSLEDSPPVRPATMRRNLTSSNLPRNVSHTKLKKNYSHGQLQRLGSTKDLVQLTSKKPPPSPGLKGKSKRPKSSDWALDKDLHEREVELLQQQQAEKQNGQKKVGFKVGSADDDDSEVPNMDGSGLDEGEWTEESASVSPYSTRVNTANNSRRTSMQHDRPPDRSSLSQVSHFQPGPEIETTPEEADMDGAREDDEVDESPTNETESTNSTIVAAPSDVVTESMQHPVPPPPTITRSPLHAAKEHPNPTAQLLRRNSNQLPAPALVSNVNAGDESRSSRPSPAGSVRSGNPTPGDQESDELVSRFIPSTSHGSGTNTTMQNTPKSISFHTPNQDDLRGHRDKHSFGPVSPGSTISGSSGAATPAHGRSRIELRMLHEKALADMETAAERGPSVPAHVYDRRNETLKSYLHLASLNQMTGASPIPTPLPLGPEIFQGRFKAVNTELKVVQKFRSPIAESVTRLQSIRGSKLSLRLPQGKAGLRTSKSAVTLPVRGSVKKESGTLSNSTTPPKAEETAATSKPVLMASKSSVTIKPVRRTATRGVSFAGMDDNDEAGGNSGELTLDDVAKEMWDSVLG